MRLGATNIIVEESTAIQLGALLLKTTELLFVVQGILQLVQ